MAAIKLNPNETISDVAALRRLFRTAADEKWTIISLMNSDKPGPFGIIGPNAFHLSGDIDNSDVLYNIAGLTHLQHLNLINVGTEANIIPYITELPNLLRLTLTDYSISEHHLAQLSKLKILLDLKLVGCNIGTLSAHRLGQFRSLKSLHLAQNQIGSAGAMVFCELSNLKYLDLALNRIADSGLLELARCHSLEHLDLSGNKGITSAGVLRFLEKVIESPALSGNLKHLDITSCTDLSGVLPGELIERKDAQAILAAFRRRVETQPLNEVKILVVGNEAVGKTSLIKYLMDGTPRNPGELKTRGVILNEKIDIHHWHSEEGPNLQTNIWDFGGQEIMHGTHRYFLTKRSLYLLVLEARREDDQDEALTEWLRVIRDRGEDSPVIVVINKAEEGHLYQPNEALLKKEYPAIVAIVRTTCNDDSASRDSIQHLRRIIIETVLHDSRLTHVKDPIPRSWLRVKDALESLARTSQVVDYAEYRQICNDRILWERDRISSDGEQFGLLGLLHDLGVVVAHGLDDDEQRASLREITLLDPNWLTSAIYALLNSGPLRASLGQFDKSKLGDFLDLNTHPMVRHEFIVDMMQYKNIALCVPLHNKPGCYLVPEALPVTEPDIEVPADALRLIYQYDYLPASLIPRLIVEAYADLGDKPTYWRKGLSLRLNDCRALIRANRDRRQISVAVWGPCNERRSALSILRNYLERVHRLHNALGEKARVPLPDQPAASVSYDHLLNLEKSEGSTYRFLPEDAKRKYTVSELLDGVRRESDVVRPAELVVPKPSPIRGIIETIVAVGVGLVGVFLFLKYTSNAMGSFDNWVRYCGCILLFILITSVASLIMGHLSPKEHVSMVKRTLNFMSDVFNRKRDES